MRNGVYLILILFLGSVGFYAINGLYTSGSMLLAGTVFFLISIGMYFLTTHYKKHGKLSPAQKVINVIYIGLFALYGIVLGLSLMAAPEVGMSATKFEGGLFIVASLILLYGEFEFMRTKLMNHDHHGHREHGHGVA